MIFDLDDLDDLVLRALHVELDLGVLVGGADRAVAASSPCRLCPGDSAQSWTNQAASLSRGSQREGIMTLTLRPLASCP